MVSDAILGALVGGGLAVAGSYVQAWFNRKNAQDRIEAENQRHHAEIYAGEKVEALSRLHSNLVECRQTMSKQLGRKADDLTAEEVRGEILPLVESLQVALDRAAIFLDEDQIDTLSDAYLKVSEAGESLEATADNPRLEPSVESLELIEDTEEAMEVLRTEINRPIEKFESA